MLRDILLVGGPLDGKTHALDDRGYPPTLRYVRPPPILNTPPAGLPRVQVIPPHDDYEIDWRTLRAYHVIEVPAPPIRPYCILTNRD